VDVYIIAKSDLIRHTLILQVITKCLGPKQPTVWEICACCTSLFFLVFCLFCLSFDVTVSIFIKYSSYDKTYDTESRALVRHFQTRVVIFPCPTDYRAPSVKWYPSPYMNWIRPAPAPPHAPTGIRIVSTRRTTEPTEVYETSYYRLSVTGVLHHETKLGTARAWPITVTRRASSPICPWDVAWVDFSPSNSI